MTVLFADLEGFTALAERLPPNAVVALLNQYFGEMAGVVEAHGGRIDKYLGDAMLVVWEQGGSDGAGRAARAALAMQGALGGLQSRWLAEGKVPLKHRIGICSGQVIEGAIGGPARRERTVIGDAVNTAARLEAMNKEFHTDIILSQSTHDLLAPGFQLRALGTVPIKGRLEPLAIYALVGGRDDAT